jgi:GAF domain-containing protein
MKNTSTEDTVNKQEQYQRLFRTLDSLCEGETDRVALMATIAGELYHTFGRFDWVGFYRNVGGETLKIGPYQGTHGCLVIPFSRGVCGKCAREKAIQNVSDVTKLPYHIACSSTTRSELVIPILARDGELIAVLDIDSDTPGAFDSTDEANLVQLNRYFLESCD